MLASWEGRLIKALIGEPGCISPNIEPRHDAELLKACGQLEEEGGRRLTVQRMIISPLPDPRES